MTEDYWTERAISGFAMMLQAGRTVEQLKQMFSDIVLSQTGLTRIEDLGTLIEQAKERVDARQSD